MKDRIPFTYLLKFKPTGQYYYGSRYSKYCHPSQLWTTYYTSSKVIRQLIKEHGQDSFEFKITRIFENKESARIWEHRFLAKVKASKNPKWLNQHNGAGDFINKGGLKFSEEHKRKISEAHKGKPKPKTAKAMKGNTNSKGNKFSEESRKKLSIARIGNKNRLGILHSDEIKKIISERTSLALKGKPKNVVTCPHCGKSGGQGNMKRYHFINCHQFKTPTL
jgi:hypothetical protein